MKIKEFLFSTLNKQRITIQFIFFAIITTVTIQPVLASYNTNVTPIPNNFYTKVDNVGDTRRGVFTTSVKVGGHATGRITFIIPPGVDRFMVSNTNVRSWNCYGTGKCYYGHSFNNYSNAEDYNLASSTGYTISFINTEADKGSLTTTPTTEERRGYFIIKNDSNSNWELLNLTLRMYISNVELYNAWIETNAPSGGSSSSSSSTSSSGGSTSSTSSSSSSTSSSSSSTSSSGGTAYNCGGLTGVPCDTSASSSSSSSGGSVAPEIGTVAEQFEAGINELGYEGVFSQDDKYVYCKIYGQFDFDGTGFIDTTRSFRVNIYELQAYIDAGNTFSFISGESGLDPIDGYMPLVISSSDEAIEKLYIYPNIEDESVFIQRLMDFSNVIYAGYSDHGVVYVITEDKKLHRGILNHHMVRSNSLAPQGTVQFERIDDLNGDDFDDYSILYDNGYMQYLYYKAE